MKIFGYEITISRPTNQATDESSVLPAPAKLTLAEHEVVELFTCHTNNDWYSTAEEALEATSYFPKSLHRTEAIKLADGRYVRFEKSFNFLELHVNAKNSKAIDAKITISHPVSEDGTHVNLSADQT